MGYNYKHSWSTLIPQCNTLNQRHSFRQWLFNLSWCKWSQMIYICKTLNAITYFVSWINNVDLKGNSELLWWIAVICQREVEAVIENEFNGNYYPSAHAIMWELSYLLSRYSSKQTTFLMFNLFTVMRFLSGCLMFAISYDQINLRSNKENETRLIWDMKCVSNAKKKKNCPHRIHEELFVPVPPCIYMPIEGSRWERERQRWQTETAEKRILLVWVLTWTLYCYSKIIHPNMQIPMH